MKNFLPFLAAGAILVVIVVGGVTNIIDSVPSSQVSELKAACSSTADCDDDNLTTIDWCMVPGTNYSRCVNWHLSFFKKSDEIIVTHESRGKLFTMIVPALFEQEAAKELLWWENCYWIAKEWLGIEPLYQDGLIVTKRHRKNAPKVGYGSSIGVSINMASENLSFERTAAGPDANSCRLTYPEGHPYTGVEKEFSSTYVHELTHFFVGQRMPTDLGEGLAQYTMWALDGTDYEPIECQESGFVSKNGWAERYGYEPGFYAYNTKRTGKFTSYQSYYCFWKMIESRYGETSVHEIIKSLDKFDPYGQSQNTSWFVQNVIAPVIGEDLSEELSRFGIRS